MEACVCLPSLTVSLTLLPGLPHATPACLLTEGDAMLHIWHEVSSPDVDALPLTKAVTIAMVTQRIYFGMLWLLSDHFCHYR